MSEMSSPLSRLASRILGASIVEEAFTQVVGKPLDAVTRSVLKRQYKVGGLDSLLEYLLRSEDGFRLALERHEKQVDLILLAGFGDDGFATRLSNGGIESRIADKIRVLAASDSSWTAQLTRRSEHLIQEARTALLGRTTGDAVLDDVRQKNTSIAKFVESVRTLACSDDLWQAQLKSRSHELLDAVYWASLRRKPDDAGRAAYHGRITSIGEFGVVLSEIISSDEHWQNQIHQRADNLVKRFYSAILDRQPSADEAVAASTLLSQEAGIDLLLDDLSRSNDLWFRQLALHADTVVQQIVLGLAGVDGIANKAASQLRHTLHLTGDLRALVSKISELAEFEAIFLRRISPTVVIQLYLGIARRHPTEPELLREIGNLVSLESISTLARSIAKKSEIKVGPATQVTNMLAPDFISAGDWGAQDGSVEEVFPEEGFYAREDDFFWSCAQSSVTVTAKTVAYVSCNYLEPGQERVVHVFDGAASETLKISDQFVCIEVRFSGDFPRTIFFSTDGVLNPKQANQSDDDRNLGFQLHLRIPASRFAAHALRPHRPCLLFVGNDKKEQDSLYPIYKRMLDDGHSVRLVDVAEAVRATHEDYSMVAGYVIAMGGAFVRLHEAGCRGSFIYVEHGVSPIKRYTYGAHYLQYDLVLLPGRLWVERLNRLYPRIQDRCRFIGYPKLHREEAMSGTRRAEICAELGLDPTRPIIIFAPTWSGGDRRCGIFNIEHFDKSENVLAIPHDGDVPFCEEFVDAGYRIHRPPQGKSISDYYPLADILVSDVSSTAIEFAFFGKPVVCLELTAIQDFDERYLEGPAILRIPHTNEYWDFCEWTSPQDLTDTLFRLKASGIGQSLVQHRIESAKNVVAYCGEEASRHAVNEITGFFKKKQFF